MILVCTAKIFQDNYRNIIPCYLSGGKKIYQAVSFFRLLVDQAVTARREHELSASFFELVVSTASQLKISGFSAKLLSAFLFTTQQLYIATEL